MTKRRRVLGILITAVPALITAVASAWLIAGSREVRCDALAPLTVLATLAAFVIALCFRQMGRYPDRRSRWILFIVLLVAAATLFADFRCVRRNRGFCSDLQQQMQRQ